MAFSYQRAVPACLALLTGCVLVLVFIAPFYGALDPVLNDNSERSIIIEDFDYSELDQGGGQETSITDRDTETDKVSVPEPELQITFPEKEPITDEAFLDQAKHLVPDNQPMQMMHGAIAVAAGRLEAEGYIITLNDIVVTQVNDQCIGDNFVEWNCGVYARTAFRSWVGSKTLSCRLPENPVGVVDVISDCVLGVENAAEWLVRNGWVKAADGGAYVNLGKEAENARRGIWGNKPVSLMPEIAPLPQPFIETPSRVRVRNGERPSGYFPPIPRD